MVTIDEYVRAQAANLVRTTPVRSGRRLDYGLDSAHLIEEMLAEIAPSASTKSGEDRQDIIEMFGCYLLEVARRKFGGRYVHSADFNAPVLVVGGAERHVALITYRKVEGRLGGDEADNIPFFFDGFVERARGPVPDRPVLYV